MTLNDTSRVFTIHKPDKASPIVLSGDTSRNHTPIHNLHQTKTLRITKNIWNLVPRSWQKHHFKSNNGIYGLFAMVILCTASFSATLLPVHNAIVHPEYWYEIMYSTVSMGLLSTPAVVIEFEDNLNLFNDLTLKVILDIMITTKIVEVLSFCTMHLFWTDVFGYFEPFPRRGNTSVMLVVMVIFTRLWRLIPKQKRMDSEYRKMCKAFLWRHLWGIFMSAQLIIFTNIIRKTSRNIQWLVALLVPLTKEINDRVFDKLIAKSALPENFVKAKFIGRLSVNITYSVFLSVQIATLTTKATGYILLAINFYLNMVLCYKVIRLGKKVCPLDLRSIHWRIAQKEVLTELILNEIVEIMVPVAYISNFLMAHYGPNKNRIGNIGCSVWEFQEVEDIHAHLIPVIQMALVDSGSLILSTGCLWWFCRINIWREYCANIKKYWMHIALIGGSCISGRYIGFLISAGNDDTSQFMWINDDEKRNDMISNVTCFAHDLKVY